MATYPAFAQLEGSEIVLRDDTRIAAAMNGLAEQFGQYTEEKHGFVVKHLLNDADQTIYWAFYATNRKSQFTFTHAATRLVYNALFVGAPHELWTQFGWQIEAMLVEV